MVEALRSQTYPALAPREESLQVVGEAEDLVSIWMLHERVLVGEGPLILRIYLHLVAVEVQQILEVADP